MVHVHPVSLCQYPMYARNRNLLPFRLITNLSALFFRDLGDILRQRVGSDLDGVVACFGCESHGVMKCPTLKDLVANSERHTCSASEVLPETSRQMNWSA